MIVHTCAVTAEADRQARQAIRRLRRERPEARIVVTGCGAQVAAQAYAAMPEIDHVVGNAEKLQAETWNALPAAPRLQVGDIMLVRETAAHLVDGFDGRTRAFLEVQQGCDHRCTFCIIPYGRGPSRSVPVEGIVAQARALVANGYREVVITGVDIASYGKDLPEAPSLGRMLKQLLAAVPELPRLRLSSIDPAEIDPDLEELVASEPRLMPHLHLSVQAGDDLVLKRMKRRHSAQGRHRTDRTPARAACGHRVRSRPDRRVPDRGRGDVPADRGSRGGGGADLPARLPLLAALRHAGGADAAGGEGGCARSVRHGCGRRASGGWTAFLQAQVGTRAALAGRAAGHRPHGPVRADPGGGRHRRPGPSPSSTIQGVVDGVLLA